MVKTNKEKDDETAENEQNQGGQESDGAVVAVKRVMTVERIYEAGRKGLPLGDISE